MALFLLTVSLGNYLTSGVKFLLSDETGNSLLKGASEFWFWTILMAAGATVYLFVSKLYKVDEYLHDAS
jgi:POT family proton-dependent oligopeptide transporter